LLTLYERALPVIYGYLLDRCGDRASAEDLTSETFLAAVTAIRVRGSVDVSLPWLVGVARHKLADHWRRRGRDERLAADTAAAQADTEDPWAAHLDAIRSNEVLEGLSGSHRAALTLRYVDGLSVAEVAETMGRTIHATEGLLVRARGAYRRAYSEGNGND
jgi:RNA polymerase sigma-70 factor (ECF subfamily)